MTVTSGYTLTFDEADFADVDRLGGKGAGLARMTRAGLRVPPGYIVATDACRRYLADGTMPDGLVAELLGQLSTLEARTGKTFGGGPVPLLLSVRSGAPVSMPGMMDTVLNLGLDRAAAVALAEATGDVAFMAAVVARFHAMYAEIVFGVPPEDGDPPVASDDPGETFDRVWAQRERALRADTGDSVPERPRAQLLGAVEAVFRSWNNRRARTYREHHGIPHDLGTAVVVQSMVFGNLSADSGSGVVFTRDPATGAPGLFGEYLANSQGEDVVAGVRTPDPVADVLAPDMLAELRATCAELERRHGDVLDIEFTVERSVLYFLQVRVAKRTPEAAVRIAADFLAEGVHPAAEVLARVTPAQLRQVQRPGFDAAELAAARAGDRLLATGIGACPGQVSGRVVLTPDRAKELADAGADVILARRITSPADLHGMIAARGIVTATGGATSHAAVVARALGTACVVGVAELTVADHRLVIGDREVAEGEEVSIDGATGEVFAGRFRTSTPAAATDALSSVVSAARTAAGCAVFGRVTRLSDVDEALAAGATGLVSAVDDVLATTGTAVRELVADHDAVARLIEERFGPIFAAAGAVEVGVRAIDPLAEELVAHHPAWSVPLGPPGLVEAQLAGLAAAAAGTGARVHLAVRHLSDVAESRALAAIRGSRRTAVGAYLTSPRGVVNASAIAESGDVLWLDFTALQAAVFGLPASHLLATEPLDGYLGRGLLSVDPRAQVDPAVEGLLEQVAAAAVAAPRCAVGVRLTGPVADPVAHRLYGLGLRRFAIDVPEFRPLVLALAQAAG
jgi:pyruvate, orthophosphate dikinase